MLNLRQYDELRKAEPFKPFRIVMSDGAVFDVPHREFAWRTPTGGLVFVATQDGEAAQFLDPLHITRFEVHENGRSKRRSRRSS